MSPVLKPWQLWVVALAGWINEQPGSLPSISFCIDARKESRG